MASSDGNSLARLGTVLGDSPHRELCDLLPHVVHQPALRSQPFPTYRAGPESWGKRCSHINIMDFGAYPGGTLGKLPNDTQTKVDISSMCY